MIKKNDIEKTIAGCLASNPVHQRALIERISGLLYVICYRYLADEHSSKDALQEILIKIFSKLTDYDTAKGKLESWVSSIAIRHCLNSLKARQTRSKYYQLANHQVKFTPDLEQEMISSLHADQLLELVAELPEIYRTIFNMASLDGYSHKEIAVELGTTEINSRTILRRARKRLQEQILSLNQNESWVNSI